MPRHVKKGDNVIVISGSQKGQVGEIMHVDTDKERVLIKGVNLKTRHVRPTQTTPQGGIIQKEAPLHWSNVSPVVDGKPTRVRFDVKEDGTKTRVAARGGKELSQVRGPRKKA